jgi:hypothetical protein
MRSPDEQMSQRRLVEELRISIDEVRSKAHPNTNALDQIADLVRHNPKGIHAAHVQHNIGRARREWLTDFLRTHADIA